MLVRSLWIVGALFSLGAPPPVPAQSGGQGGGQGGVRAVYATRAEAEKAARYFHCSGAHRMGEQWMPCASHGDTPGAAEAGAPRQGGSH